MVCKNCNAELDEGTMFCGTCGQRVETITPEVPQPAPVYAQQQTFCAPQTPVKSGPVVIAKKLKIWVNILLLLPVISFVIDITISYFRVKDTELSYSLIEPYFFLLNIMSSIPTAVKMVIDIALCLAVPILYCRIYAQFRKAKKMNTFYCPKCKTTTAHNRFAICTDCKKDYFPSCLSCVIFSTLTAIAGVLQVITPYNSVFHIIYPAMCLITLILPYFISFYMIPSKVARKTGHNAAGLIYWLNVFLGGTVIIWIVLLIVAYSGTGNMESKLNAVQASQQQAPPNQG